MSRRGVWPKPFTSRNLIDSGNIAVATVRGVEWVTDRYVMARADLFAKPPAPRGFDRPLQPTSVAKVLRGVYKSNGPTLEDSGAVITSGANTLRLMCFGRSYVPINDKVAHEWLSRRTWHKIQLADPSVAFYELRRGRPVLAGLIMPVRLHSGTWELAPLLDATS